MKRLSEHGKYTVLPIVGDALTGVHVETSRLLTLVTGAADEQQSVIEIEDPWLTLTRGDEELRLNRSDYKSLSPLLGLIGLQVTEASILRDDTLLIIFANGTKLTVCSTTGFEAWHFRTPRPGSLPQKHVDQYIRVDG